MAKMTSAYANKMLRKLNEDYEFWRNKENNSYLYTAAADEEPVIPDYDYATVAAILDEINEKILKIKHAINVANVNSRVPVGDVYMSVDTILVKMAQLNKRKRMLDIMRKQLPQSRVNGGYFGAKKTVPEYQYINYDLDLIKREYERVDAEVAEMQIALDKHNQTFEFDVEI